MSFIVYLKILTVEISKSNVMVFNRPEAVEIILETPYKVYLQNGTTVGVRWKHCINRSPENPHSFQRISPKSTFLLLVVQALLVFAN